MTPINCQRNKLIYQLSHPFSSTKSLEFPLYKYPFSLFCFSYLLAISHDLRLPVKIMAVFAYTGKGGVLVLVELPSTLKVLELS